MRTLSVFLPLALSLAVSPALAAPAVDEHANHQPPAAQAEKAPGAPPAAGMGQHCPMMGQMAMAGAPPAAKPGEASPPMGGGKMMKPGEMKCPMMQGDHAAHAAKPGETPPAEEHKH